MVRFSRKKRKSKPHNNAEFFKIYLPEHNSQHLLIPAAFINKFDGKIPEKVILNNAMGSVWEIEIEQTEQKLLMKKGWEVYVKDNALERGEFLVFRYDGNAVFTVKIFGINGCEKDETIAILHRPLVKVELEAKSDVALSYDTDSGSPKVMKAITEKTSESHEIRLARVDDGKKRYDVHIPGWIFRRYKITPPVYKFPEEITIRDQAGFSVKALIYNRIDRIMVSRGWRQFQVHNKFRKGDEYELGLILGEERKVKEIVLVRISRKKRMKRRKF